MGMIYLTVLIINRGYEKGNLENNIENKRLHSNIMHPLSGSLAML